MLNRTLLLGAALAAVACGGGGGYDGPTSPPAPQVLTVEVRDTVFSPRSVTVPPGGTVRWIMRGAMPDHTTIEENGLWNSGAVFTANGATFERTFPATEAGRTFQYYCSAHRACCQMQGSVRVGENAPPPPPGYE